MQVTCAAYDGLIDYITQHGAELHYFAYGYVKNRDDAEDVVQEAFLKAIRSAGTLRDATCMKSWLFRIVANEGLNTLRRRVRCVPCELPDIPAPVSDLADMLVIRDAVYALPPRLREVIVLRFYEDMKLSDIACTTGLNLNTVKSRLYTALRCLREEITS